MLLKFRALLLLLLLLSSCCAENECHDRQGRPGIVVGLSSCGRGATSCGGGASYGCELDEFEPRAVGSTWQCDAGYEMVGARITWPGGVMATRPDKCTPMGGRFAHMPLSDIVISGGKVPGKGREGKTA